MKKRIVIATTGSRGDVQPYLALAKGLLQAGFEVCLATHEAFRNLVESESVAFRPVPGDPEALLGSEAGRRWLRSGNNSFAFLLNFVRLTRPYLIDMSRSIEAAARGADLIIFSPFASGGLDVGEAHETPTALAALQPYHPTRAFPAMGAMATFGNPWMNWMSHRIAQVLLWLPFRSLINRWRQQELGLPPRGWKGPFPQMERGHISTLYGYSQALIPRPADWNPWVHVTGYWYLDQEGWQPPAGLEAFLESGPQPIYVGFGSMNTGEAPRLVALIREAAAGLGVRVVLQRGWEGLELAVPQRDFYVIDSVPHSWLFPRMAALVHHGGAGTTGAGLRAGVPAVFVPHFADQFFWAGWCERAGISPPAIDRSNLTAEGLAGALEMALGDQAMRSRSQAIGNSVSAEDGVQRAVEIIQEILA